MWEWLEFDRVVVEAVTGRRVAVAVVVVDKRMQDLVRRKECQSVAVRCTAAKLADKIATATATTELSVSMAQAASKLLLLL
jgi:hypothetical protein